MTIPKQTLDLRKTKCPLNFVQTKLALEKLGNGDILEIWISTAGESVLNIPQSIRQEGHEVVSSDINWETDTQRLRIRKC